MAKYLDSTGLSHLASKIKGSLENTEGKIPAQEDIQAIAGDLATIAYEFHKDQLGELDLDSVITFQFPDDVKSYGGVWDSANKKYYANKGTGA